MFIWCLNTRTGMINTNVFFRFFDFTDFQGCPTFPSTSPWSRAKSPEVWRKTAVVNCATRGNIPTRGRCVCRARKEGIATTSTPSRVKTANRPTSPGALNCPRACPGESFFVCFAFFVFLFFVCFALFIDLWTDKVQPLSRWWNELAPKSKRVGGGDGAYTPAKNLDGGQPSSGGATR